MFFLAIRVLKIIISTFFEQQTWNQQSHVSHPIKCFGSPLSSPHALHFHSSLSLSVLTSLYSTSLNFSSFSVVVFSVSVSLFTTGLYAAISLSNSASCPYSCSLFFSAFLSLLSSALVHLPFLFGFFCLPFVKLFFHTLLCAHHWLYNMHNFVIMCGVFFSLFYFMNYHSNDSCQWNSYLAVIFYIFKSLFA